MRGPVSRTARSVRAVSSMSSPGGLTDRERDVLAFEREWARRPTTTAGGAPVAAWQTGGAKITAVRERFGLSEIRYLQLLNRLIDRPAAMAVDPITVGRLQRLRAKYLRTRSR